MNKILARLSGVAAVVWPAVAWGSDPLTTSAAGALKGDLPLTSAVQIIVIMAVASLIPAIVLTCTCFARFLIVFSFLKSGLGTQSAPPSQVLVGLALFMTAFVMAPVVSEVHERAAAPYMAGQMTESEAVDAASPAIKRFLLPHTREEDLALFYDHARLPRPSSADEVPLRIAVPAFVLSELRTAFQMGLVVLLPFLIIDLVMAVVLSSLGMVMLPPTLVSLPVKLLVFVAADGWHLLVSSLLEGAMK